MADDVTDISLQAVAGAAYPIFHPDFKADPLATQLGDGVDKNDKEFRGTFPYLALPVSGLASTLSNANDGSSKKDGDNNSEMSTGKVIGIAVIALLAGILIASLVKRRAS